MSTEVNDTTQQLSRHEQEVRKAREGLSRLDAAEASKALKDGALLVDTRPLEQRQAEGEVPGAVVISRNSLEGLLDPTNIEHLPDHVRGRVPDNVTADRQIVVFCNAGVASSLAAASLQRIGLHRATDIEGGFQAWKAAGLPIVPYGAV